MDDAFYKGKNAINVHYADLKNQVITAYRAYEAQAEAVRQQARKKKRRGIVRAIVGIAVGAFVAPIIAPKLLVGVSSLGLKIAEGVIFGAISSAITKNNILQGAVFSGIFSGFSEIFQEAIAKHIKEFKRLREVLKIAVISGLQTAIYRGKFLENALAASGSHMVDKLLPSTSTEIADQIKEATIRGALIGGIGSMVQGFDKTQSLVASGMGGVQALAGSLGHSQAANNQLVKRASSETLKEWFIEATDAYLQAQSQERWVRIGEFGQYAEAKPSAISRERTLKIAKRFGNGVEEGFKRGAQFLGEEAARVQLGEPTVTGALVKASGTFIGEEIARLTLGEKTKIHKFMEMAGTFIGEETARVSLEEQTYTEVFLARSFEKLSQIPAEKIAFKVGEGFGDLVLSYGVGKVYQGAKSFIPLYDVNRSGVKSITTASRGINEQPFGLNAWESFRNNQRKSIKITGGRSVREFEIEDRLAAVLYTEIRNSVHDVQGIAKNLNMPEFQVRRIKEHIFYNTHKLDHGMEIRRFDPDFEIATAWKRMEAGIHTESDLLIIKHEHFESRFEGIFKTDYKAAHNAAKHAGYPSGLDDIESFKFGGRNSIWDY